MKVDEQAFRRRVQIEIILLDPVDVVGKLRQLRRDEEALFVGDERRPDRCVAAPSVAEKHELDQRHLQLCAEPNVHRKPRSRDRGSACEVEDSFVFTKLQMRHHFAGFRLLSDLAKDDLVLFCSDRRRLVRDVRQKLKELVDPRRLASQAVVEFADPCRDRREALQQVPDVFAGLLPTPDFFRPTVPFGLQLLDFGDRPFPLLVEFEEFAQIDGRITSSQSCLNGVSLFSKPADVKHLSSFRSRRRILGQDRPSGNET
jgi:hypothetical protein